MHNQLIHRKHFNTFQTSPSVIAIEQFNYPLWRQELNELYNMLIISLMIIDNFTDLELNLFFSSSKSDIELYRWLSEGHLSAQLIS